MEHSRAPRSLRSIATSHASASNMRSGGEPTLPPQQSPDGGGVCTEPKIPNLKPDSQRTANG